MEEAMSKLDELVKKFDVDMGDGLTSDTDVLEVREYYVLEVREYYKVAIRAYIEERFGPLMRQTESDAETLKAVLARAKEE